MVWIAILVYRWEFALAAKYFAATQGLKPKCRFYTETKAALPKFSI
jgi:hypothetical protein